MRTADASAATGMRIIGPAVAGLIMVVAGSGARAQETSQPDVRLTIGSMVLGELPTVAKVQPRAAEPPRSSWRHTFGSERTTREVPVRLPKVGFAADLVALQGVTGVAQARQAFPADEFNLIVSRQLMRPLPQVSDPAGQDQPPAIATTAVAVRRRPDLRVTGQEHLTRLAQGPSGALTALSAGTAVHILAGTRPMWVLSINLAEGCSDPTPENSSSVACQAWELQLAEVARWIAAKRAAGEAALVAGVFHRVLEKNNLPETLAILPRAGGQGHASTCTARASDIASTYLLLSTPGEAPAGAASPDHPQPGGWSFVDGPRPPADAPCALLTDLVAR